MDREESEVGEGRIGIIQIQYSCTKVLKRKQREKQETASCNESRPLVICLHIRRHAACSHHFTAADLGVHADHPLFHEKSTMHPHSPLNSLYSVNKAAVEAWIVGVGNASGVLVRTTLLAEVILMAVRVAGTGFRNSSHRRNARLPVCGQALAPKQQGPRQPRKLSSGKIPL